MAEGLLQRGPKTRSSHVTGHQPRAFRMRETSTLPLSSYQWENRGPGEGKDWLALSCTTA